MTTPPIFSVAATENAKLLEFRLTITHSPKAWHYIFPGAKIEIQRPFPQEEELKQKSKRLDELNIQLNLNEKDKEIIDDGLDNPDNNDKNSRDYQR